MKIVFIITGLYTGGAEMMLYKLLENIDRNKFKPTVISLTEIGEIGPKIEALDIQVLALGMNRRTPNLLLLFQLSRMLKKLKPAVIHTWMYHADLFGGLAARLAGLKNIIWGLHHSNLSKTGNKTSTLITAKICALLSNWLPVEILSCSHRGKIIHAANGYVENKIHVIPNGFDLSSFSPNASSRNVLRSELRIPSDAPIIGVVGRYNPQKNHLGFLFAANKIIRALPATHFILAGTDVDNNNETLTSEIKKYPLLQGHIHLLGRRTDVPLLMSAFDVLALPSSFGEAFPLVLGEAMGCGIPCVVTDVGDSAEIVGSTGRVVQPGDMVGFAEHLIEILQLPQMERAKLGQMARARVQDLYEINHIVDLHQKFYERVSQY